MATTVLSVPTISCHHCEKTITEALTPLTGVSSVRVDIPSKQVTVDYDASATGVEQFKDVLAEEDYPVESAS
ncbi:MAG: heavy-metal-associated domain-containing protein [Chloroflexi bacterium]|nr:heavy-metal-associated domain-containing protein [Chloroflexota bacterium]